MHRSYLKVKRNDLNIYFNSDILKADALIIDVMEANFIFNNFNDYAEVFKKIKELQIDIYLDFDLLAFKEAYKALMAVSGDYIKGLFIANPNKKEMIKLLLMSRDYEVKHKLAYKSLEFILVINKMKGLDDLARVIKASRVKYILYENIAGIDNEKYLEIVTNGVELYHKNIIEPHQFTGEVKLISKINDDFTPSEEKVKYALNIINNFNTGTKQEKKLLLKKGNIYYHYQVLELAQKLGKVESFPSLNFHIAKKKITLLKKPIKIKKFYTLGEEIANAVSHGAGIMLAIIAIILLLFKGGDTVHVLAYLTFGICALLLYMMSTLYHAFRLGNKTKLLFQKFDHMTIYLLIAGTYTPFSLLTIGGKTGLLLCCFIWAGSLTGLLLNLFAFGRFRFLHMLLYVALGWAAIFFLPQITQNLAYGGIVLLIIGGVMYTLGIFFYALRLFKYTHMIWHIFTVFGTLAHLLAILFYV